MIYLCKFSTYWLLYPEGCKFNHNCDVVFNGLTWRHQQTNVVKLFSRREHDGLHVIDVHNCIHIQQLVKRVNSSAACMSAFNHQPPTSAAAADRSKREFRNICIENKTCSTGVCFKIISKCHKIAQYHTGITVSCGTEVVLMFPAGYKNKLHTLNYCPISTFDFIG